MLRQVLFACLCITILVSTEHANPSRPAQPNIAVDEERKALGESKLRELKRHSESSPCWKAAVSQLDASCKDLTDLQQSRLAVAFANCHLAKSGRHTYPCDDTMTIKDCTRDMNSVAFQTYTEFFTHTGHICYFLQSQLWQERTENVIFRLSDSSHEALGKLEESLEYHKVLDGKQNLALDNQEKILDQDRKIAESLHETREDMGQAFTDMREMAEKQKRLLSEMFTTLQNSVETIRYLMSLFLVEFVGYETFAFLIVYWLIILFVPRFGYSRFKLHVVLFADIALEIVFRKVYGYFVFGANKPPPESLNTLHTWLWNFRYLSLLGGGVVYMWEWLSHRDYELRNMQNIDKIQRQMKRLLQVYGIETTEIPEGQAVYGGPPVPRRASEGSYQPETSAPPTATSSSRHSWPSNRTVQSQGFTAALNPLQVTQPPELTMRDPYHQPIINRTTSRLTIDSTSDSEPDSGDVVDSARSAKRFLFRHRRGSSQQPEFDRQHPLSYEQRGGLPLSVGHNDSIHSTCTSSTIRSYVYDSDSDADTFVPSDDPMVRQPIRVRGGSSSPGSIEDKNRPTQVSRATTTMSSKKRDPLSPSHHHHHHHKARRTRRGQVDRARGWEEEEGHDSSNLLPSNLPDDWCREKEVTEEKQMSNDTESPLPSLTSSPSRSTTWSTTSSRRRSRGSRGRSRRSEPVVSSTTGTTTPAVSPTAVSRTRRSTTANSSTTRRRRTLPPGPPPATPQTRYNLRSRTPSHLPPLNE